MTKDNKSKVLLAATEEVLSDLESGKPLEDIIAKCKKIARLRSDERANKWFFLETNGYLYSTLPPWISKEEALRFALFSGRGCPSFKDRLLVLSKIKAKNEEQPTFFWQSVSVLESIVINNTIALQNLKPPENYTPAITKSGDNSIFSGGTFLQESYRNVLDAVINKQQFIMSSIQINKELLSKIRNSIYDYVLTINLQLRFENKTESLFQEVKIEVDKKLTKLDKEIMQKFAAAYDRLDANNPEEWSQAASSCRNALKTFANSVFPATDEKYTTKDKRVLDVTDIKVKNRLIAYIDKSIKGNKKQLLIAKTLDLENRIHSVEDILSQGTHDEITKKDLSMIILETYFLISSLLDLS